MSDTEITTAVTTAETDTKNIITELTAKVDHLEQIIADARAKATADITSLTAMVELDHQRVDDFITAAETREAALVVSVEAKIAAIKTDATGFVAWVKGLFGGK